MKILTTLGLVIFFSPCLFAQKTIKKEKPNAIVGTWKLIEFTDLDSATNTWIFRYGKNLRGYFTYNVRRSSINISSDTPLKISEEESKKYTVNIYDYITKKNRYFGTYTGEPEKGRVTHHVKGSTIPWYTDTKQTRQNLEAFTQVTELPNDIINPLFEATVQATEEAIINAMVAAETMEGINGNKAYALPHKLVMDVLKKYNRIK